MAFTYITEFAKFGRDLGGYGGPVGEQPPLAEQKLVNTGGSVASAAFNVKTRLVRVHTDSICSVLFGTGTPAAAVTNARMAANTTEYFMIDAEGHFVNPVSVAVILNT